MYVRTCKCKLHENECDATTATVTLTTLGNLTISGQGTAKESLSSLASYDSLTLGKSYDNTPMPLERQRGVDMNDLWEAGQHAKEKINAVYATATKKSKKKGAEV